MNVPHPTPANQSVRKAPTLSSRQLLDVELGLFLLDTLLPAARPDALLTLLHGTGVRGASGWTPRQHKLLHRGRAMLAHIQQPDTWHALLDAYTSGPQRLQAYDLSADRSRFREKSVGFFRNRIRLLKQTIS